MEIILGFIGFILVMLFLVRSSDNPNKSKPSSNSQQKPRVSSTFNPEQRTPSYQKRGDPLWNGERKLTIEYQDREGNVTNRPIKIKQVYPMDSGEIYFQAYCELREDNRTFKAEGVLEIITARKKKYSDFYEYMSEELKI
ncbi:hypothetical protein [Vibrio alginolyticus]|uniref:WYL domain-containing protein n=1 Tax=Vibrio alginolyticus TaxID=663 RepID=UPI001B81CAD3|nr:hypothetical protein [Vibrio alginolyticus]ELB2829386.1 hypothetical protein [Vibrio alginolyticus]MBS9911985.1 hypothetical protein [Vibrio alginolyticus]MBT0049785.1 hypothetical protein [Vibrio alginolyticus]MBT0063603.1 hypothetical protein [Vibrio alginolyticus]HBC3807711.1 hypothetical protein [Vibrio alginolyticus]